MLEIISKEIQHYCAEHSNVTTPLLSELREYTFSHTERPNMVSGADVGNILQFVSRLLKAKKILDIGTFTGYSALTLAETLDNDGELHTFEMDEHHRNIAASFFARSEHNHKIKLHFGAALKSLDQFKTCDFDLAFIDADKSSYKDYYQRALELVKIGGVIILDNMLWSGTVLKPIDADAVTLRQMGDFIQNDDRVSNFLLPVRDGLMICYRIK